MHGVLKYPGRKGGKKTEGFPLNVFSGTTQRNYVNSGYLRALMLLRGVNLNNLISVTTTDSPKVTAADSPKVNPALTAQKKKKSQSMQQYNNNPGPATLCLLNACSLRKKSTLFIDFFQDCKADIFFYY